MKLVLKHHAFAKNDIQQQVEYYAHQSGLPLSERFVQAVQETLVYLTEFPGSGSLLQTRTERLRDIRCWPVKHFPKHLIFYRVRGETLLVLRVLHGARQTLALLRNLN